MSLAAPQLHHRTSINSTALWVSQESADRNHNFFLFMEDKAILQSSCWLNDNIICAAQCLLKKHTEGDILGFQSTQLCKRKKLFNSLPPKVPFIQVMNVNESHWITVSNIRARTDSAGNVDIYPDTVCVYDCNWCTKSKISLTTKQEICSFYKPTSSKVHFEYVNVDRQPNSSDCGVFALAFATELAHNSDPTLFCWDINEMRKHLIKHLINCLERGQMTPFPKHSKRRLRLGQRVRLGCRMPDNGGVRCAICLVWYHMTCVSLDPTKSYLKIKWRCPDCVNSKI